MGMPTVSLALLSLGMGLPSAVQIMVVPTVVTNVWQALIGNGFGRLCRRFRSLLAATAAGVWVGYVLLFRTYPQAMTAVLGACVLALSLGAADYVPKPEAAPDAAMSAAFRRELIEKVRTLGRGRSAPRAYAPAVLPAADRSLRRALRPGVGPATAPGASTISRVSSAFQSTHQRASPPSACTEPSASRHQ